MAGFKIDDGGGSGKNIFNFNAIKKKAINCREHILKNIKGLKASSKRSSVELVFERSPSSSLKSHISLQNEYEKNIGSNFSAYSRESFRGVYSSESIRSNSSVKSESDGAISECIGHNDYVNERNVRDDFKDNFFYGILYNIKKDLKKFSSNIACAGNLCINKFVFNALKVIQYFGFLKNDNIKFEKNKNINEEVAEFIEFIHEKKVSEFSDYTVVMPKCYSSGDYISGFSKECANHKIASQEEKILRTNEKINAYIYSVFGNDIAEKIEGNGFELFNSKMNLSHYRRAIPKGLADVARRRLNISGKEPLEIWRYINNEQKDGRILLLTKNEEADILLSVSQEFFNEELFWFDDRRIIFYKTSQNAMEVQAASSSWWGRRTQKMQKDAHNKKVALAKNILGEGSDIKKEGVNIALKNMISEYEKDKPAKFMIDSGYIIGGPGYIHKNISGFFGSHIVAGMERVSMGHSNPMQSYYFNYKSDKESKISILEKLIEVTKNSMVIPETHLAIKEIFESDEKVARYCKDEREKGRSILLNKDEENNIILLSVKDDFRDAKMMWGYESPKHKKEIEEWDAAIKTMSTAADDFMKQYLYPPHAQS